MKASEIIKALDENYRGSKILVERTFLHGVIVSMYEAVESEKNTLCCSVDEPSHWCQQGRINVLDDIQKHFGKIIKGDK